MKLSLLLALFKVLPLQALEISVAPVARSYPLSASIEANIRDEYIFWDQRDQALWKFGFLQPRAQIAAHGMVEAGLNFYPISFLELGASASTTSRFYNSRIFDCVNEVCKGVVNRERLTVRLVAAFEDWIAVLSMNSVRSSTQDDSKPMVDEVENILAARGGDTLQTSAVLVGKQIENIFFNTQDKMIIGLVSRQVQLKGSEQKNESQYVVAKVPGELLGEKLNYAAGFGRYASSVSQPGVSIYATVIWTWGKSQALF